VTSGRRSAASKMHPFNKSDLIFEGEIQSRLEEREGLIDSVLRELKAAGCRFDELVDRLSLDEAITNAILHGNQSVPTRKVVVRAYSTPECWGVEIINEGPGYDWKSAARKARTTVNLESPAGRGLTLILGSGADVHFLDRGRRILIVRRLAMDKNTPRAHG